MKGILVGTFVLFGAALALNAYGFSDITASPSLEAAANADAAMTPDSGTSGVGYGTE